MQRAPPMSRALRIAIYALCGLLWVSGTLWLVLHYGFAAHNEFGELPNPWEPVMMRVHGLLAVAGMFILGWVTAAHIAPRWSGATWRKSGLVLAGCALVLVVSGYALYYTTAGLHVQSAVVHEALGLLAVFAALAHWLRIRAH